MADINKNNLISDDDLDMVSGGAAMFAVQNGKASMDNAQVLTKGSKGDDSKKGFLGGKSTATSKKSLSKVSEVKVVSGGNGSWV